MKRLYIKNLTRLKLAATTGLICLFSFGLLGGIPTVLAQETTPIVNSTLDGIVVDAETQEPLAGATLQLSGVTHATKSDSRGRFRFVTGQKFPYTIIASYIG